MNDLKRVPTVESLLSQLRGLDLDVRNVVDVGVLSGTGFLVEYFPKAKHHLFEPVDRFFDVIRAGYQGLDFDLHHLAVSSTSGMAFQVGVSADGSARVTHSYVSCTGAGSWRDYGPRGGHRVQTRKNGFPG